MPPGQHTLSLEDEENLTFIGLVYQCLQKTMFRYVLAYNHHEFKQCVKMVSVDPLFSHVNVSFIYSNGCFLLRLTLYFQSRILLFLHQSQLQTAIMGNLWYQVEGDAFWRILKDQVRRMLRGLVRTPISARIGFMNDRTQQCHGPQVYDAHIHRHRHKWASLLNGKEKIPSKYVQFIPRTLFVFNINVGQSNDVSTFMHACHRWISSSSVTQQSVLHNDSSHGT